MGRFFSIHRDPSSLGMDAFAHPWSGNLLYIFLPFRLIPEVLQKIQTTHAKVIVITPFWLKRVWFPVLHNLSITDSWKLPVRGLTSTRRIVSPASGPSFSDCLATEEELLKNKGLSEKVICTYLNSRKKSTNFNLFQNLEVLLQLAKG